MALVGLHVVCPYAGSNVPQRSGVPNTWLAGLGRRRLPPQVAARKLRQVPTSTATPSFIFAQRRTLGCLSERLVTQRTAPAFSFRRGIRYCLYRQGGAGS